MITALAIAAACSWNHPGADPTTSSVPATLHAMGIDSPELAAKIERGEYAELVTIHKNDARMRGMTSGNARWCDGEVDTSRWSDEHAEMGRVYRVGDLAVVWYWRCKNMSLWLEREQVAAGPTFDSAAQPDVLDLEALLPAGPTGAGTSSTAEATSDALASPYGYAAPAGFTSLGGGGFAGGSSTDVAAPCPCPPIPAVPEPSEWLLLLAGMLVGALVAIRNRRR